LKQAALSVPADFALLVEIGDTCLAGSSPMRDLKMKDEIEKLEKRISSLLEIEKLEKRISSLEEMLAILSGNLDLMRRCLHVFKTIEPPFWVKSGASVEYSECVKCGLRCKS